MDRRRFLQIFGGGVVASATMAEAGFLAEFMAWLKRKPVWSIPKTLALPKEFSAAATYEQSAGWMHMATIYYDRKAIDNLKANLKFTALTEPRVLPAETKDHSIKMLRYAMDLGGVLD